LPDFLICVVIEPLGYKSRKWGAVGFVGGKITEHGTEEMGAGKQGWVPLELYRRGLLKNECKYDVRRGKVKGKGGNLGKRNLRGNKFNAV